MLNAVKHLLFGMQICEQILRSSGSLSEPGFIGLKDYQDFFNSSTCHAERSEASVVQYAKLKNRSFVPQDDKL
jgi:hypothetical protein